MDCSSLGDDEHKTLAEATLLARKSRKRVFEMGYRKHLWDLAADGFVERLGTDHYHLLVECTCGQLKLSKAALRALSVQSSEQPELPQQTSNSDPDDATSVGSRKKTRGAGNGACEGTPPVSTSLRSRDGSGLLSEGLLEPLQTGDYRYMAGKTISGARVATEVAARYGRHNRPSSWQDKPVAEWNAAHLAGYFSAQAFARCKGLSPDVYNTKAQMGSMARLRKFGISNEDIKRMVDIYLDRVVTIGDRVPSLWRQFFSQVPDLQVLLTSPATKHYNNQPTPSDDDKEFL